MPTCPNMFTFQLHVGGGSGAFLRWWPPSSMWAGPLIYFGHHWGCLYNPIFANLGLCAACWARFMCHHELWPTSVSHPFSSLNISLGFAGGKHYQKITIPFYRLALQNCVISGYFPYNILFYLLAFFRLVCCCNVWLYLSDGSSEALEEL